MGWEVEDLKGTVNALKAMGVHFEEYRFPGLVTVDGVAKIQGNYHGSGAIAELGAWFYDNEGNLLS
jgi:hypothetical protein